MIANRGNSSSHEASAAVQSAFIEDNKISGAGASVKARVLGVAALLVVSLCKTAVAVTVPIDSNLFTVRSTPGISSWTGDSLTLDLFVGGPLFGGFTQTPLLDTAVLPSDIVGISFAILSSLSNARISFAYVAYDAMGNGQGAVELVNYVSGPVWDLTSFSSLTSGLGGGRTTSDAFSVFLGAKYNPFALDDSIHNQLSTYPKFSLDFRADGWDGSNYVPGTVTFANIQWITADAVAIPLPGTLPLFASGLGALVLLGGVGRRLRDRIGARRQPNLCLPPKVIE